MRWWFAVLLLLGCSYPNHRHDLRMLEAPADGPELELAIHQTLGVDLRPGNQVELLENGAVFDALVEEIGRARSSINLLSYIWRPSLPSDRILEALRQRRPGVACRVLVDPLGSVHFDATRLELERLGCDARFFRPLGPSAQWSISLRNHRRVVIADGRVAVLGGFGIWRSWEGQVETPDHWRDINVRVAGPVVEDLQVAFAQNWQEAGGRLLGPEDFPPLVAAGGAQVAAVPSTGDPSLSLSERMFQLLIASARHRLWVVNSYFIPSTAVADSLVRKSKEGVDVRVLVPGSRHDLPFIRKAQQSTYSQLLSKGVRIWEYQPAMMHAKAVLVDDHLVMVGSNNLDPLSLKRNQELAVLVDDPRLAAELEQVLAEDFRRSAEVRWEDWRHRGLLERVEEALPGVVGGLL